MIKRVRIALVLFFIAVAAVFAYTRVTAFLDADDQAPVITAESDEIEVSVNATDAELMQGMTATDNRDGDVTDSLVVVSRTKFIRTGELNITYAAFDGHNNVGTYIRRVKYTDYTSPEFSITKPLVFQMGDTYPDYLDGITATDVLDGDLTSMIRLSTGMSTSYEEEEYYTMPLTIQVTNTAGDTVTLDLEETFLTDKQFNVEAPALTEYLVYTDAGTAVDAESFISGIRNGKNEREFTDTVYSAANISWDDSAVDYNTPGVYQITYTLYQPDLTDYTIVTPTPIPESEDDEDEIEYVDEDNDGWDDVLNIAVPEGAIEAQEVAREAAEAEEAERLAAQTPTYSESGIMGSTVLFVVVR